KKFAISACATSSVKTDDPCHDLSIVIAWAESHDGSVMTAELSAVVLDLSFRADDDRRHTSDGTAHPPSVARERPRSVRRDQRGSEGDGALPVNEHAHGVGCGLRPYRHENVGAGLRTLGGRGPGRRSFIGFVGLNPADALLRRP